MSITVRRVIDRALARISLSSGSSAQIIETGALLEAVQHRFDVLFQDFWLKNYMVYGEAHTLTAGGVVTADLSTKLKDFYDLKSVFYNSEPRPLEAFDEGYNPSLITRRGIQAYNNPQKVFRVRGSDVSGTVYLTYRSKPDDFVNDDDIIMVDDQLMILGTAWDFLNGLGTNPAEEDKLAKLYNDRLNSFKNDMIDANLTSLYGPRSTNNAWREIDG